MSLRKTTAPLHSGAVIGTIHSPASLKAAQKLKKGAVDFLELRVDAFSESDSLLAQLKKAAPGLLAPLVVTVRDPKEGGVNALSAVRRRALLREFFEYASLIDVELRSTGKKSGFSELLGEARERGIGLIFSHHDFRTTPPLERLQELAARAGEAGATVFKVATMAKTASAFSTLLEFLALHSEGREKPGMKLAVMGMGEFGKISRLALGSAGSVLNYGYLHKPQVSGQWPAELLKDRLRELAKA
jgi:3-dehydroquinate dehydratase-1